MHTLNRNHPKFISTQCTCKGDQGYMIFGHAKWPDFKEDALSLRDNDVV